MNNVALHHGNCLDILPQIPDQSVDAVITDPPYPHIKRDYGYWTTEEWWELIVKGVIPQVRRILKPTGSAVFILQPNSKKVGKMRGWLWEFMAWVCREWNMVQDVWWWNYTAMPSRRYGMLRSSVKACVWCGTLGCYRNQEKVLWAESDWNRVSRHHWRIQTRTSPSGHTRDAETINRRVTERGGVTPYNLLPFSNGGRNNHPGTYSHSAGTPLKLADWWTRYICPPGGIVLDPFMGSGTMGLAALQNDCGFIGIDQVKKYVDIARQRIDKELHKGRQLGFFDSLARTPGPLAVASGDFAVFGLSEDNT